MSFFPKKIKTFEIHRKEIDMRAWVKGKFKDGKHLELINYSELENERFTLVKRYDSSIPFQRQMQVTEIKGEIVENKLIYSIELSMMAKVGMLIATIVAVIFSIGLLEERNFNALIFILIFYCFFILVTRLLLRSEITHYEKFLEEEMRFI